MKKLYILLLSSLLSSCAVQQSPTLQPFSDVEYWIVRGPLIYEIGNTGEKITVPVGFVTDFASVPPKLRPIFPKIGKYLFAAIVHDYLYWNQVCSKDEADEIFFLAMKESGVGGFTRHAFFQAVDKAGMSSWDKNKQNKKDGFIKIVPESHINALDRKPNLVWPEYSELLKRENVSEPADPNEQLKETCSAIEIYRT